MTDYMIQMYDGSDTRQYLLDYIQDIRVKQDQPLTPFNIPGEAATSTILLAFEGQTKEYMVDFRIVNDGEEKDNSTYAGGSVITIPEQIDYLTNVIHLAGLGGVTWTLFGDFVGGTGSVAGVLTNFDISQTTPTITKGRFTFTVGSVT